MNRRAFLSIGSMSLLAGQAVPALASSRKRLPANVMNGADPALSAFLENDHLRIGINLDSGGAIFYFSRRDPERNLLNYHDTGRFIQQSYYGDKDGSRWCGHPWRWNPIQGGGCNGERARVLDSRITSAEMYVKTEPKLWATGADVPQASMEEWISLHGETAHIHFKFTYHGTKNNEATTQELPAIFADYQLSNLVCYAGAKPWTNAQLTRVEPGWPNKYVNANENWAAFVDEHDWGLGVYFPGTSTITTYRYRPTRNLTTGPQGNACSYLAPTRRLVIVPGFTCEYDIELMIGRVSEIRRTFYKLHSSRFPEHTANQQYVQRQL